jgi:predicted ribosome quality control (RQC) complex YloA/Tae2 family protein
VIAGRDAQQNELLVKRYMRKGLFLFLFILFYFVWFNFYFVCLGDAYVHAEIHGASSCIVKGTDFNN